MAKHVITPAWQTQRGGVVQAAGCAEGVPVAGAKVFGETRQNLWSNPTGTQNGVTVTANDDGSLTLAGTATQDATIRSANIFVLKPSTQYTVSADKVAQVSGGRGVFSIYEYDESGFSTAHDFADFDGSPSETVTFTTIAGLKYCAMVFWAASGTSVSGTYRVMLNEGSTAQPWCPPGLSSVSELGIVAAGKNLLPGDASKWMTSNSGTSVKIDGDSVTVSDTNGAYNRAYISVDELAGKTVHFGYESTSGTGTYVMQIQYTVDGKNIYVSNVDSPHSIPEYAKNVTISLYSNNSNTPGQHSRTYVKPYLCVDGEDGYTPMVGFATTPVDLSGHQLRSLPDGTRDVLGVDGSGAVEIEQRVGSVVLDGTLDVSKVVAYLDKWQLNVLAFADRYGGDTTEESNFTCDTLPCIKEGWVSDDPFSISLSPISVTTRQAIYVALDGVDTAQGVVDWFSAHPTHVLYRRLDATVPLDPITPPTVPAADATLWASSNVPCDLEATTWTASGAEQGRQQAAMVKVAQQVRQQAETVAALAAQSLEG